MKKLKTLTAYFCMVCICMSSCIGHTEDALDDFPKDKDNPENAEIPNDIPKIPEDIGDPIDDVFIPNTKAVNFENAVSISFTNQNVAVVNPFDGNGVTVVNNNGNMVITSTREDVEVNYILSGVVDNGSVKIYGNYKFGLVLNGVSLTNPHGAAINIQCGKKITVTVVDGTNNRLIDGSTYIYTEGEDMKATFFAEGKLNMYGKGTLEIRGKNKHAICSDDYFHMYDGNIHIKESASDGIHAKDEVLIEGGILTIRSTKEGVESENDMVDITGGVINIVTTGEKSHGFKSLGNMSVNSNGTIDIIVYGNASKGFSAGGDMKVSKGTLNIMTAGDAFYETSEADISSNAGIKCDGALLIEEGGITIVSSGKGGKGISVDGELVINGGTLTVTTSGGQYVYDKNNDTAAKAVKSEGNLTVNGGTIVLKTYGVEAEGLESKNILTITGGNINVQAYDDCINASTHIQIDGGSIYCSSATNDGIDSNGTLTVTGGLIVSAGSTRPEEGFDCDRNRFTITGGTLVGIGGATSTPTANVCTQRSLVYNSTGSNIQIVRIETTSGGKEVMTFKMPRVYSQQMTMLFSSPALEANTSYTVYTGGGIVGGTDFHGLFTGATYTKGTSAGTFTTSQMVSTVGSSGGGPGGR